MKIFKFLLNLNFKFNFFLKTIIFSIEKKIFLFFLIFLYHLIKISNN